MEILDYGRAAARQAVQELDCTAWAAEAGKQGGDWDPTISTFPKLCGDFGRFLCLRFSFTHLTPVLRFKLAVSTNRSFMANIRVPNFF